MQIELISNDFLAYSNIKYLCQCRNMEIKTPIITDIKEFNTHKNSVGYFMITASTERSAHANNELSASIVFICSNSDYHKKAKFVKIKNMIPPENKGIVIKSEHVNLKTDYVCEVIDFERYLLFNWYEDMQKKGRSVRYVSEEEFERVWWQQFYIKKEHLPLIEALSHEAVWHNLKRGDICELYSPSLSSNGNTCSLRRVI